MIYKKIIGNKLQFITRKDCVLFDQEGIASDSKCRILITDLSSNLVHILDQGEQFLCYIEECQLNMPWGLCVHTKDNLIVAEYKTGKLKKNTISHVAKLVDTIAYNIINV